MLIYMNKYMDRRRTTTMKTTLKKLAAIVLVSATVLSLAACSKGGSAKKVSKEDFVAKIEKEGFQTMDAGASEETDTKENVIAFSEEGLMVSYSIHNSKEGAKKQFDEMKESAEASKKSGEIEKLSTSSSKITASSAEQYLVVVYADDMTIAAMGTPDNSSKVDSVLKAIGVL